MAKKNNFIFDYVTDYVLMPLFEESKNKQPVKYLCFLYWTSNSEVYFLVFSFKNISLTFYWVMTGPSKLCQTVFWNFFPHKSFWVSTKRPGMYPGFVAKIHNLPIWLQIIPMVQSWPSSRSKQCSEMRTPKSRLRIWSSNKKTQLFTRLFIFWFFKKRHKNIVCHIIKNEVILFCHFGSQERWYILLFAVRRHN